MWSASQVATQRAAKRRSVIYPTINVWPFVAVMIALLVIFMTNTTPFHYHLWAPVDLPSSVYAAAQPSALREDAMRISIRRDGEIYFRNSRIAPEELPRLIQDAVRAGGEKKICLLYTSPSPRDTR